jgi:hypothetical protein
MIVTRFRIIFLPRPVRRPVIRSLGEGGSFNKGGPVSPKSLRDEGGQQRIVVSAKYSRPQQKLGRELTVIARTKAGLSGGLISFQSPDRKEGVYSHLIFFLVSFLKPIYNYFNLFRPVS